MEQFGDKVHDATPHKRQQAREKGQVAKSQDLGTAALMLAGVGLLLWMGKDTADYFGRLTTGQLGGEAWLQMDSEFLMAQWQTVVLGLAKAVLPILGLLFLGAVLVQVAQTGLMYVPSALALDFNRVNPVQGFSRIFSISSVMRLVFGLIKVLLISVVAGICLWQRKDEVLALPELSVPQIAWLMTDLLLWTAIKIAVALLILAVLDYGFQKWKHEQDLKMTTQELKDEMKQTQGDPMVAARRRQVHRQIVENQLASVVPKADFIVTNPTELAIAIQYDDQTMEAPVVLAKGEDAVARRIRMIALEHGIPVVERKPLARALYAKAEINQVVPSDLWEAMAEVVKYIWQLKGKPLPSAQE